MLLLIKPVHLRVHVAACKLLSRDSKNVSLLKLRGYNQWWLITNSIELLGTSANTIWQSKAKERVWMRRIARLATSFPHLASAPLMVVRARLARIGSRRLEGHRTTGLILSSIGSTTHLKHIQVQVLVRNSRCHADLKFAPTPAIRLLRNRRADRGWHCQTYIHHQLWGES